MKYGFDSAAEGVLAAEEGCLVGELGGGGFACPIVGAPRGGGFENVERKTETLKCTGKNVTPVALQ
jgi:hypothetical protein